MVIIFALILLKGIGLLIDRVIRQMHKQIVQIAADRCNVLGRCEPRQSLFIQKNSQRRHTCQQHINTQIKLQSINQIGLMQIPLRNVVLLWINPIVVTGQEDPFALAAILRLNYECFGFALIKLLFELFEVGGEYPRFGKELELTLKILLHG